MFLGKIDWYIIKKFIGTYFFSIVLILSIAVVFDINAKLDMFQNPNCSLYEIIFHYYLNFVPFFANLFSPLFVFISVIFFTSKLSENNEVISMMASGISFARMLRPYMMSALFIALLSTTLNNFVIPIGTKVRLDFEDKYISTKKVKYAQSIQIEVKEGELMFIGSYDNVDSVGYQFALESYNGRDLTSRLTAEKIYYLGNSKWKLSDFRIREFTDKEEKDSIGYNLDSIIPVKPTDFLVGNHDMEMMTTSELVKHVNRLQERGVGNYAIFQMEIYSRIASIFSSFILTFIGVALSSKKKKNGMGINIAIGVSLCFIYIFLMNISSTFAIGGRLPVLLSAWIPNILYSLIGLVLYYKAIK